MTRSAPTSWCSGPSSSPSALRCFDAVADTPGAATVTFVRQVPMQVDGDQSALTGVEPRQVHPGRRLHPASPGSLDLALGDAIVDDKTAATDLGLKVGQNDPGHVRQRRRNPGAARDLHRRRALRRLRDDHRHPVVDRLPRARLGGLRARGRRRRHRGAARRRSRRASRRTPRSRCRTRRASRSRSTASSTGCSASSTPCSRSRSSSRSSGSSTRSRSRCTNGGARWGCCAPSAPAVRRCGGWSCSRRCSSPCSAPRSASCSASSTASLLQKVLEPQGITDLAVPGGQIALVPRRSRSSAACWPRCGPRSPPARLDVLRAIATD